MITARGVVVHVQLERHTPRRIVNRRRNAYSYKGIARPSTHQIGTGVVAIVREQYVVVVGVCIGLEVKRQKVDLHRISRLIRAQRDGVVLVGIGVLEIGPTRVVIREVDGLSGTTLDGHISSRNGDNNAFLSLRGIQPHCHSNEGQDLKSKKRSVHVPSVRRKNTPICKRNWAEIRCTCQPQNELKCEQLSARATPCR